MGEITIVGLGPGSFGHITVETFECLLSANILLLRTEKHPTVPEIIARDIKFTSYDHVYDKHATFEEVYEVIANDCINRALEGQQVTYAVPGSPLVAERTVVLIREKAQAQGIKVKILPGMSFLEVLYTSLGVDPIDGITVVDAGDLASLPQGLTTSLVVTQVYNKNVASDTKLTLMEYYPDDYEIMVIQNLSLPNEQIHKVPLFELDRIAGIDHLTSVYVPAYTPVGTFDMSPVVDVMNTLRSPGGCVWDIEQNHKSLRRYIIEEVYEVLEAIELEDEDLLCEELGDLLLQIVFHARIAEESKMFSMQDVIDTVTEKMIRRHPHVFGEVTVADAAEVVMNWDEIKKIEKGSQRKSVLDGVSVGLPSLMRAYKLQSKAAKVGFDWPIIEPVWDKLYEEISELKTAVLQGDKSEIEKELGDVLFTIVNLSRFLKIDAEVALNSTNNKFVSRFSYIENTVKSKGVKWENMSLNELDVLWKQAKSHEN